MILILPRLLFLIWLSPALALLGCASVNEPTSSPLPSELLPEPVVDMPPLPSETLQELKAMQQRWDSERQRRRQLLTPSAAPSTNDAQPSKRDAKP